MARINHGNSRPPGIPECLLLDSSVGEVHPNLAHLLQNLEKAQGDTLAKIVAGLRGYNVSGFSLKVFVAPKHAENDTPYELRVVLEYNAAVKSGINHERVRTAYLDALQSGDAPALELPSVAKPGK